MKMCDEVITVFNAGVDPQTRADVWTATVIRGVSWHGAREGAVESGRGGLAASGGCVIRIPEGADAGGREYAEPAAWDGGGWTLRIGDVVARGAFSGAGWSPAALRRARAQCVTIVGVTDNRRGARGRHWRVEGRE